MPYRARHRLDAQPANAVKRTLATTGLTVVATAATLGASAAAWACPTGSDGHARTSVHRAVAHGHGDATNHSGATSRTTSHGRTAETSGTRRGASPSNPDGMSNGGADKPGGAAAANDNVDGNNGSGNDTDCEDDNNGVGTPGHCRTSFGAHHETFGSARRHAVGARIGHGMTNDHRTTTTRQEIEGVGAVHTVVHGTGNHAVDVTVVVPGHPGHTITVTAPGAGETATVHVGGFVVAITAMPAGAAGALFTGAVVPNAPFENGSSLSRPNGETSTVTVAAPAAGTTTLVPATLAGSTVPVALTGTTAHGGTATVVPTVAALGEAATGSTGATVLGTSMTRGATTAGTTAVGAGAAGGSAGASVSPSSTQLPFTGGSDVTLLALIGAGGVVTGAGVLRAARGRRTEAA